MMKDETNKFFKIKGTHDYNLKKPASPSDAVKNSEG